MTAGGSDLQSLLDVLPAADDPDSIEFDRELRRALFHRAGERVRGEVQRSTWEAFWETAVLGTSAAEAASKLGMSVEAVRVAKCRVLARVRAVVAEWEDEQNEHVPCSIELLESALAGELPPEREELLHRHLKECEACTAAMEEMAGGEAGCREAAAMFKSDELDEAWPGTRVRVTPNGPMPILPSNTWKPSDEPGVLGRLGGYDVLEIIGRGGMGVVLKGYDPELKRCVAIKVLAPHLAQSSLAKKRFAREAQAAAAVVHPERAGDPPGAARRAVAVSGHAAGGRRVAGPAADGAGPAGTQGGPADRHAGGGRPGRGPRAGAGASRREAGQHSAGKRRRAGGADRFRPGPRRPTTYP